MLLLSFLMQIRKASWFKNGALGREVQEEEQGKKEEPRSLVSRKYSPHLWREERKVGAQPASKLLAGPGMYYFTRIN